MSKKAKHSQRIPFTQRRKPRLNGVPPEAQSAADRMEKLGASPRIQLGAARQASGQTNLTYKPHQGRRERLRRALQAGAGEAEALALNPAPPTVESVMAEAAKHLGANQEAKRSI